MFTYRKLLPSVIYKQCNSGIINVFYKMISNQFRTLSNESNEHKASDQGIKEKLGLLKASYEDGFTCFKLNVCAFCSSKHLKPSQDSLNFFINKKTGNFICHKCKVFGTWSTLDKIFNLKRSASMQDGLDLLTESSSYDVTDEWHQQIHDCTDLCDLNDRDFESVLKEFKLSQFSKQDFKKLGVKINADRSLLFFPMHCHRIVVGYRILDLMGSSSTFPKADCPGVLSQNVDKNTSTVIVVADITDFISLGSLKLSHHIICLPYGVKTLPQNILPLFERYQKIVFWLGEQCGAWHSSIQFARKLSEKRCYLIRPMEKQVSATKAIENGENVREIILKAKPIWHQFVTTFSSLREDVLAEIQNVVEISGVPWMRFPQLTNILKGHRRGELTILTGPTGCGKTTFLSEYSLDLALQGVNTLWGSFEIKNSRLARTMLQQFSGISLTPDNLELVNIWANKFENLPIYFLTFHGQHSIDVVMNAVEHCSYTYDIAHVLIDNIQFMMDVSVDSNKYLNRFWSQDVILQSFRKFATANNCHVTLVIHPRKEMEGTDLGMNSIFGTAKAAQEADNIFILQENRSNPVKGRKYLQVCKNRFSGDLGRMALDFDKKSLCFSQKGKQSNSGEMRKKWAEGEEAEESLEDVL